MAPVRRPWGRVALAAIFALLALNALAQVALVPLGRSDDPGPLVLLQALVGLAAAAAAWGSWTGARWAPYAAAAYGVVVAVMLLALEPLLDLGAASRGGLRLAAGSLLGLSLLAAWWLRRSAAARPAVAGDVETATLP